MPPDNFNKRVADTCQFQAEVTVHPPIFNLFLIFEPPIHRLSTRHLKPIARVLPHTLLFLTQWYLVAILKPHVAKNLGFLVLLSLLYSFLLVIRMNPMYHVSANIILSFISGVGIASIGAIGIGINLFAIWRLSFGLNKLERHCFHHLLLSLSICDLTHIIFNIICFALPHLSSAYRHVQMIWH